MATRRRFDSRKFRARHDMTTAQELADKVGVDLRTVQSWDAGHKSPSPLAKRRLNEIHKEHQKKTTPSTSSVTDDSGSSTSAGPQRQGFLPSSRE